MKGHSLMGHRGKVQKHLGERPICRSPERKGKQCFSRCRPVTLSWILVGGMWLDGIAHFSTCLPVGHTSRVPPSGWCFLPVVKETAGTWLIKKNHQPRSLKAQRLLRAKRPSMGPPEILRRRVGPYRKE